MQLTPDAIGSLTPWITAGALVVFGVERGVALARTFRKNGTSTDALDAARADMRDALTTQQLNFDNSLLEFQNGLRDIVDDLRKELTTVIRERRR